MDYELSYPIAVKDSFLTCTGYSRDGADQDSNAGAGYIKRKESFAESKTVQLIHKIDADLFNQELYLVNNVEIDIEITPHENSKFLFIQPIANLENYALEIVSCKLFVKTVDLMDGLA
ncbi:MAG TPA: hypothetical protein VJU13_00490 [Candidatus Nitrosocosmicus sp.]|nr:hypothetical protein [Nitrososphaeraceae archaeon]HKO63651.1 hypothetical protein [Candidatus Nitrosocosmicus sp.]